MKRRRRELEQEALKWYLRGLDIVGVASQMGVSERRAHALVQRGMARMRALEMEELEGWRAKQLWRLEQLIFSRWEPALEGERDALHDILRMIGMENELLGLERVKQDARVQMAFMLSGPALDLAIERELMRLASRRASDGAGAVVIEALEGVAGGSEASPVLAADAGG